MEKRKTKVLLGLSGGVDSAVALYLLKQNPHYEVDCLFMRNWDSFTNQEIIQTNANPNNICPQEVDFMDATKVATQLDSKLIRVDFIKEYWDDVFTYFLDEYKRGRTPNPDILCNNEIKFKAFLNYAIEHGYDYIATGHYAINDKCGNLYMANDQSKDQSYFLAQLTIEQLAKVIFPLGKIKKEKVRALARKLQLVVSTKKDSTGICFIGERNINEFLSNYLTKNHGAIIYQPTGEIIGSHDGLFNYTIGQRKGLGFGTLNGHSGPWFVVGKNHEKNQLLISNKQMDEYLYSNNCVLYNTHFRKSFTTLKVQVRFRHLQKLIPAIITFKDAKYRLYYNHERAVTPGQLVCIYYKKLCVGGGFVDEVYQDDEKRQY